MNPKELLQHAASDVKHVRRNTIVQIVIATLAFILLCRIWPMGLVQRYTESKQQAYSETEEIIQGDAFTIADKKLQTVRFSQEHIYQMMLYLSCSEEYDIDEDYVIFRIYNDSFFCIFEEEQNFSLIERQGGFLATPDMDVDTDRDYYYEVLVPEEDEGHLYLPVADRSALVQQENTILYVDGIYHDDISLIAEFTYSKELTVLHILVYDILILVMAGVLYLGILWGLYYFEDLLDKVVLFGKVATTLIVVLGATVFLVYATIMNVFGGEVADRVVYAIAAVTAVAWFIYAVWMPGTERKESKLLPEKQVSLIRRNYIQTVSFALLIYSLCQYVNADRLFLQRTNTRWMLIFFGIALLMIQTGRELRNYMNVIWLGISLIGSVIYCHGIEGEQELQLAKLTAAVVVIWGMVIISVLRQLKRDFWKTIHWPMLIIWLVFIVFMWVNRFKRVWVFTAVLPFVPILFMNLSAAGKSRLLKNFTNGILLSFGLVMMFSLVHRPYHYWMRYRYNGIFHTVACTGMYLVVVSGAAIGKLYGKWREGSKLLRNGKMELFILAAVVTNILLSMSRTAILTLGVNLLLVVILAAVTYKKSFRQIMMELCLLGIAIVISFPLMYSVIRVVPAVINDPIRYELEPQDRNYMIYEGDKVDSDKYMTIRRYFTLFFDRLQTEDAGNAFNTQSDTTLLAYIGENSLPIRLPSALEDNQLSEKQEDVSNGRFEIYQDYLSRLTIKGHDSMQLEGKDYAHAHNSYIQVAYDFGLIAGIAFLILCAVTLWRSIVLAYRYGKNYNIFFVPFSLIIVFGMTSLTEWAFHPCIPTGFAFLFVQILLMQRPWSRKSSKGETMVQQAE